MRIAIQKKILGVVMAVIVSLVTWIVTEDVLSSISIAFVVELIALVLETQIELEKTEQVIIDILSISEATAAYKPLREAVFEYDSIMKEGSPLHISEAKRRLLEFEETIGDLKRGRISIPSTEAFVRGGQILDTLENGVIMSDIVMDPNKWSIGDHPAWQEANIRVAKKGLKMTRIFIVKDHDFLSPESPLLSTIKEQSKAGITVRYATLDELDSDLIRDCGILDDKFVMTSLFTPAGEFGLFVLETSQSVVDDSRRYFERLLARSHSFDSLSHSNHD